MKYKIFIIEPRTPFHIGIKEGNLEKSLHYVPSDTLFSAFCNVYRLVYGRDELENLLEKFLRGEAIKTKELIDIFRRTGSIDFAKRKAKEHFANVRTRIQMLEDNHGKHYLEKLVDYVANRVR